MAEASRLTNLHAALRRGTKATKLRLVAGVCDKGHTLAEVFVGDDGKRYVITTDRHFENGAWVTSAVVQELLDRTAYNQNGPYRQGGYLNSSCRCNGSFRFDSLPLSEAIDAGKKRVLIRVSK